MSAVVHIAAPLIATPDLKVQRCARCGIALIGPTLRHPAESYGWPDGAEIEYGPVAQFLVSEQSPRTGEDCDPGWRSEREADHG